VRAHEDYPGALAPVWLRKLALGWRKASVLASLVWSVAAHPHFFDARPFRPGSGEMKGGGVRPLFGWAIWLWAVLAVAFPVAVAALLFLEWFKSLALVSTAAVFAVAWLASRFMGAKKDSFAGWVLRSTQLHDAILNEFYLKMKLFRVFEEDGKEAQVDGDPMPVLLVISPLGEMKKLKRRHGRPAKWESRIQVWPAPDRGATLTDALATCLTIPGLLRPQGLNREEVEEWFGPDFQAAEAEEGDSTEFVDGAVVRKNPLPALFDAIKEARASDPARFDELLSDDLGDYRVHLVYNSPISKKPVPDRTDLSQQGELKPLPNCIDSAMRGMALAARRDSRLEVWQTNYTSEFQIALEQAAPKTGGEEGRGRGALPVLVDEIAPEDELKLDNSLMPKESDLLRHAAAGCRQTLATLYRDRLAREENPVNCRELLRGAPRSACWAKPPGAKQAYPGSPEICRHCTQMVALSAEERAMAAGESHSLRVQKHILPESYRKDPRTVVADLPAQGPRIVFLASGGVFRGAFHIGMLGATRALDIRPDMVVGASVGTLMGAVLGKMNISKADDAFKGQLNQLVDLFLKVDEKVGLTKRLKSAARDLAVRGTTVDISLLDVRRAVLRGSREDPGYAATGAPSHLIDAISRLLLIPYRDTAGIAAQFVAEDVAGSVRQLLVKLRDETVPRLGVGDAVLGAELLEQQVRELLYGGAGGPRDAARFQRAQPFLDESLKPLRLAFFGMAVNLNEEWMAMLGADEEMQRAGYDFVEAALSSSAFPFAFAPRRESQIYPRRGRRDVFYGDGGMFDNLPFLPAVLALGALQQKDLAGRPVEEKLGHLKERVSSPDLFLVGALDVDPFSEHHIREQKENKTATRTIMDIVRRAEELAKNEKIRSFERMTERMDRTLRESVLNASRRAAEGNSEQWRLLDSYVHPAVLPVYPRSERHLNGTFAFCRSLNLDLDRVRLSIADGCHQTMLSLACAEDEGAPGLRMRAVKHLKTIPQPPRGEEKEAYSGQLFRIPHLARLDKGAVDGQDRRRCPFFGVDTFRADGQPLGRDNIECPFVRAGQMEVFETCKRDKREVFWSEGALGGDK
jgi:predicted acylesterase/phospholipase RssA